ncbi:hypothetical protein M3Y98_00324100 [Aphelenchoides besseyi]|nr:hypothetical protein M3Y98_00324100 [Aphelenchoides besseyi]KAI6201439.1 hypothetical protein M3Y96_00841900 [Aphelenchoides besseyi]
MNLFLPSSSIAAPTINPSALYYDPMAPHVSAPSGLPPFDRHDSYVVTKCARNARELTVHAQATLLRQSNDPALTDEILLSRLPLHQSRVEQLYRQGAIYCRSGGWLEILDDRTAHAKRRRNQTAEVEYIRGTRKETSSFALLEFISVAFGLISIRGLESQNFLCMDWKGALYAVPSAHYSADCVFMEGMLENYFNVFSSCAHSSPNSSPWYVSIRKSGKARRGNHARRRQRSSHFLVVHFDETGIIDLIPRFLTQAAYRIQSNWLNHHYNADRRRPMPPLERQQKPWAPAALLSSESRVLSQILANSLNSRWPAKQLHKVYEVNSNRESERLAIQRRREALQLANRIDDTEPHQLDLLLGPMPEAERKVFRKDRRRRRRLIREEKLRATRRKHLEQKRQETSQQIP